MLLKFFKRVFNGIGNIAPQSKDIRVAPVPKTCLIQAVVKNFVTKNFYK